MPRTPQARMVDVDDLRPFPGNARRGDVGAIKTSLQTVGQYKPIVVNYATSGKLGAGTILAGNHTHQAHVELLEETGDRRWAKIRVWPVEVDDTTAERINVVDNRSAELGGYDEQAQADQLRRLIEADAIVGTGYDESSALRAIADADKHAPPEDDAPLPGVPARAKTKRGDLIELGDHRLFCGDSSDVDDVAALLGDEKADLLLTSPPYNVDVAYAGKREGRADWDVYGGFLRSVVETWREHLAAGRAVAWNIGSSPSIFPFRQAAMLEDAGLTYVRAVIWKKSGVALPKWHFTERNPVARQFTPNPMHELVYIFANGADLSKGESIGSPIDIVAQHDVLEIHQSQATKDLPEVAGVGRTGSEQSQRLKTRARKAHPAVFPIRFAEVFVRHLAGPGELVVDPFGGAGTVAIAAERLGRRAAMMEIEPGYCDVIVARWEASTGKKATRPRRSRT